MCVPLGISIFAGALGLVDTTGGTTAGFVAAAGVAAEVSGGALCAGAACVALPAGAGGSGPESCAAAGIASPKARRRISKGWNRSARRMVMVALKVPLLTDASPMGGDVPSIIRYPA